MENENLTLKEITKKAASFFKKNKWFTIKYLLKKILAFTLPLLVIILACYLAGLKYDTSVIIVIFYTLTNRNNIG